MGKSRERSTWPAGTEALCTYWGLFPLHSSSPHRSPPPCPAPWCAVDLLPNSVSFRILWEMPRSIKVAGR